MMEWFNILLARLRALFRRENVLRDIEEELRVHIEMETETNIKRGMPPDKARAAAMKSFGALSRNTERGYDICGGGWLETLWQDLHYGARMLLKTPGFTAVAVMALALGIGANTAIFSLVNAMLLKPLPYYDPQRLVSIVEIFGGDESSGDVEYCHWQEESRSFDHWAAFLPGKIILFGQDETEQIDSVRATASIFPAFGATPYSGRVFTTEEDRPGAPPVAVLSHAFWQRRFGGDPAIIGQLLRLGGTSRQVIGVLPPNFIFIRKADVFLPRALNVQEALTRRIGDSYYVGNIVGRLKPEISVEQARSELETILKRFRQRNPKSAPAQVRVTPLGERLVGNSRRGLLVLFGVVAFILLIACANVANLVMARAQARRKEMAVRAAIGAGRGRLIRQMLTESLLLSVCGGLAGLLLALLGVKSLVPLIPDTLLHLKESGVDGVALGFTFLASLLTGLITGLIPAIQTSQIDLNESLKEGARSSAFSKRKSRGRLSTALVIGELALTLTLLVGAALLIKSFLRVLAVDPGYNQKNLLTITIPLSSLRIPLAQQRAFGQDLLTRVNNLPGVEAAGIGGLLLDLSRASDGSGFSCCYHVSADYFRAMGIQLRAGRSFNEFDTENAPPVVIINESLARRKFPGENPIGQSMAYGSGNDPRREATVVGVVADVKRFGLESSKQDLEVYHSILQDSVYSDVAGNIHILVRTAVDPLTLAIAVRNQIKESNINIPVLDVMSMEQRLTKSISQRRFQMQLFGCFAVLALVIAAVGIYGVISYAVSQRTHEIGVRMALGAQAGDVLRMVIWRGMRLTYVGVALGVAAALALTRVLKGLLFEMSATDPATFASIALLLVAVALIASYIPARRATKVDPLQALRHE